MRWTRRRSGVNNAAAASVEAATPTGEENGSTRSSARPEPRNSATSDPVTIAYDSVRLISRSMSYSRYLRIPTPIEIGNAATPTNAIDPLTLSVSEERDDAHGAAGHQPLQLLAVLARRAPVFDDLADDPRKDDRP